LLETTSASELSTTLKADLVDKEYINGYLLPAVTDVDTIFYS
jgi:hypothetical protein